MPAAAVIPAPIAYIKVVAVKKLVVGFLALGPPARHPSGAVLLVGLRHLFGRTSVPFTGWRWRLRSFTLKKLECSKQAYAVNTLAWNNNIGLRSYFVGF